MTFKNIGSTVVQSLDKPENWLVKTIAQTESKTCVLFKKFPLNHDCPTEVEAQVVLVHRPFLVHDFSTFAVGVLVVALSVNFQYKLYMFVKHLWVVDPKKRVLFGACNANHEQAFALNSTNAFASRNVKK